MGGETFVAICTSHYKYELRIRPTYGQEILPSTAARLAPVAEGTLDGRRCQVSWASTANATASFAPEGRPNSSEDRSRNPSGAISQVNIETSVAFFAPPPERIISWNGCFRAEAAFCVAYLRTASAIDLAVSAVAVSTASCFLQRPQRRRNSRTNLRPNSSRPAVLGGIRRKKSCCNKIGRASCRERV